MWYELTSFTRKGSYQPLPLGQPLWSQVCEAMASKEVRHFGFWEVVLCCKSLKNLQNFWWTSRIITGWYSQAGKEAKAKANGEVAGRLDPKLLYQFVLEMSSSGTWKWKFLRLKEWCERCLDGTGPAPKMSPTTARTSSQPMRWPRSKIEKSLVILANSVGFLVGNLMEHEKKHGSHMNEEQDVKRNPLQWSV